MSSSTSLSMSVRLVSYAASSTFDSLNGFAKRKKESQGLRVRPVCSQNI